MKEKLIELHSHYKSRADFYSALYGPSSDEVKAFDALAADIDAQILDEMIKEQEQNVNKGIVE
jgi:hypothetical protein